MKHGSDFFSELGRAIDLGFEKIGLKFIPKLLRYIICGAFVFSPILAVCYILIFEEDEDIQKARKRIAESKAAQSPPPKREIREKIDW